VTNSERAYHHGNLRRALLDAAWELLPQGIDAITLRAVARLAGVSHAAPQHHFADRAALLDAFTVEVIEQLTVVLREAWGEREGMNPVRRFADLGRAYVEYAQAQPAAFALMHTVMVQPAALAERNTVQDAARRAFAVLVEAVQECQEAGLFPPEHTLRIALTGWATAYGLATLAAQGFSRIGGGDGGPNTVEEAFMALAHGLLVRLPDDPVGELAAASGDSILPFFDQWSERSARA